jgi:hypothetical protein
MAHIVGSRYLGKYFASLTASNRFFSLMAGEFRLPTKDYPLAFARSRPSPVRARINSRSTSDETA